MNKKKSLNADYFKDVYDAQDDPWNFETSPYEAEKYQATIAALSHETYNKGWEVGCSIGVLTEKLANKCNQLLATDVSSKALQKAAERNEKHPNITFQLMSFPNEWPAHKLDLIIISEVAYYLSRDAWTEAASKVVKALNQGGHVVLVHWLPEVPDYPQTGDEVHEIFEEIVKNEMINIHSSREKNYRIDVWEISSGA